jgi:hypothetical protein
MIDATQVCASRGTVKISRTSREPHIGHRNRVFRQMSEPAPSLRVRDILIDIARTWERLALETDHSAPTSPKIVLRHQFRRKS